MCVSVLLTVQFTSCNMQNLVIHMYIYHLPPMVYYYSQKMQCWTDVPFFLQTHPLFLFGCLALNKAHSLQEDEALNENSALIHLTLHIQSCYCPIYEITKHGWNGD